MQRLLAGILLWAAMSNTVRLSAIGFEMTSRSNNTWLVTGKLDIGMFVMDGDNATFPTSLVDIGSHIIDKIHWG